MTSLVKDLQNKIKEQEDQIENLQRINENQINQLTELRQDKNNMKTLAHAYRVVVFDIIGASLERIE